LERNRNPIAVLITDTHLSENTTEQNLSVFAQAFELCKQLSLDTLLHLGDIFTLRKGQPQVVLTTFKEIIDSAEAQGIKIIAIPGNHDKTSYVGESSYLDAFNGHPAFSVVNEQNVFNVGSVNFYFLPYFDEHLSYPDRLTKVIDTVQFRDDIINLLLTHCSIDGVTNNSGIQAKGELPIHYFKVFNKVFVGHYHNRQVFDNGRIVYMGSTDPRNFGEDAEKGAVVVYDDGSYEFFNFEFNPYITIDMMASDLSLDTINKAKEKGNEAKLRFRIQGEINEQLKPLVTQLTQIGVKVEVHKEVTINNSLQTSQVTFTSGDIVELYRDWSVDRKIEDSAFGEKLLRKNI